jgi:hypothetical protein
LSSNIETNPDRLEAMATVHAKVARDGLSRLEDARKRPRSKVPNPASLPSPEELILAAGLAAFYQTRATSIRLKSTNGRS